MVIAVTAPVKTRRRTFCVEAISTGMVARRKQVTDQLVASMEKKLRAPQNTETAAPDRLAERGLVMVSRVASARAATLPFVSVDYTL